MAKAATTTKKKDTAMSEQTPDKLSELLATKQADLLGYKKGLAAGELKNTGIIKATRKEIARIKTALNSKSSKEGDK